MSVLANRVKVAVDSAPGTGTIDLGSAIAGYQSFADGGITNGQVVSYAIEDGSAWEIGTGTYTTGTPDTLSRTVIESSNSGAALDLSSNAVVFITALASELQNAVNMDQGVATTDSPTFSGLSDGTTTVDTGYVVNGPAKSWVNFDATGTPAQRDSLNLSSITDNGIGDFDINFTNNYAAADYVTSGQMAFATNISSIVYALQPRNSSTLTTSYAGVYTLFVAVASSGLSDYPYNSFISIGELA